MANKNLKYFMREDCKEEQIFTRPAPARFVDEKGEVVQMEIKKLHNETIAKINEMYKTRTPMRDKKGNYICQNGEVIFKTEKDSLRATRHIIAEALVYPDLKDPDLMAFYKCADITEMPLKVFPENDEYAHVQRAVLEVQVCLSRRNSKTKKRLTTQKTHKHQGVRWILGTSFVAKA